MKYTKFLILTLIMTLLLSFSLTSCKDNDETPKDDTDEQTDVPDGNKPDGEKPAEPEVKPEGSLKLTENGKPNFTVVYNTELADKDLHGAIRNFMAKFKKAGIELTMVNSETKDKVQDCELLIGRDISLRDETIDTVPLGNHGYGIEVKGNKVIVKGGDTASTIEALKVFEHQFVKFGDATSDINNLSVERSAKVEVKQEFYVPSITVAGEDFSKYKFVVDESDPYAVATAEMLHNRIYEISGYYITNAKADEKPEHSFYVRVTPDSGASGYRVIEKNKDIYLECALPKVIEDTTHNFMKKHLSLIAEGEIVFEKGFKYTENVLTISYCEYGGAKGDGITDDFEAIKKTHDRANITGQTVVADAGRRFNVGQHDESIIVKTNTVWTGAEFIVDDRSITARDQDQNKRRANIFAFVPDEKEIDIKSIKSLKKGQENVGMTFKGDVLLYIENANVKQFIRYGGNANSGSAQREIILVHADGSVDPLTPIMWEYETLTSCRAKPVADEPITISGGTFITYANCAPRLYTSYARGLSIQRSNITLRGIKHLIREEGDTGAPYSGFLNLYMCNNVLMEDIVLSGHKTYKDESKPNVSMGTYDIGATYANNIIWKNCTQANDIKDSRCWGIMGTNYCKNMTYDGCELSRFDAHSGIWNATIINSVIGHGKLTLIGGGVARIENTEFVGNGSTNAVIGLRGDYGSTWNGDVILKNITVHNSGAVTLIDGSWVNHYFGYTCHIPKNIYIEGIKLTDNTQDVYILGRFNNSTELNKPTVNGEENKNQVVITENIYITGKNDGNFITSSNFLLNKVSVHYK